MVIPGCCVWAVVFPCVHTFHAFSDPTRLSCDWARSSSRTAGRASEELSLCRLLGSHAQTLDDSNVLALSSA